MVMVGLLKVSEILLQTVCALQMDNAKLARFALNIVHDADLEIKRLSHIGHP